MSVIEKISLEQSAVDFFLNNPYYLAADNRQLGKFIEPIQSDFGNSS